MEKGGDDPDAQSVIVGLEYGGKNKKQNPRGSSYSQKRKRRSTQKGRCEAGKEVQKERGTRDELVFRKNSKQGSLYWRLRGQEGEKSGPGISGSLTRELQRITPRIKTGGGGVEGRVIRARSPCCQKQRTPK